jgi:hypothetical protein
MPNQTFSYLIGFALSLALLGLGGNLFHLKRLTQNRRDPSDLPGWGNDPNLLWVSSQSTASRRALSNEIRVQESTVFTRIVTESASVLDYCSGAQISISTTTATKDSNNKSQSLLKGKKGATLSRFGFMKSLNNHLMMMSASNSPQKQCFSAPPTACQSTQYTMLVSFHTEQLRTLFLNLLSWITYPHVSQILVIVPPSLNTTIQDDSKYGHRLWTWHTDPEHIVQLEFTEHIWNISTSGDHNSVIQNDAVVWMNGNAPPEKANYHGLLNGLELWKRNANSVVASQGWNIVFPHLETHISSKKFNTSSKPLKPICQHDQATSVIHTHEEFHIPDLHYLIVHRYYLCFFSHKVLTPLHRFASSLTKKSESVLLQRVYIAMVLSQVTSQSPWIYNSVGVPGPSHSRRLVQDRIRSTFSERGSLNLLRRSSSATSTSSNSLLGLFLRRQLTESDTESTSSTEVLDLESVKLLLEFFGSLPLFNQYLSDVSTLYSSPCNGK